ncbi:MAG: sigma-54-dependent Fis family transcriptional regulator [Oligoflexia bacterium]|nr:sigma-54-dependent Fis family transcriptional regulator [Oligoflexia bacterium]
MTKIGHKDGLTEKLKILLVEDDELFRMGLKSVLTEYGTIDEATNNQDARRLVSENQYHIAFFELKLENESIDFNLVQKASTEKRIYTIILTAHDNDTFIEKAYSFGCNDYFVKTSDLSGIVRTVENFSFKKNEQLLQFQDFIRHKFISQDTYTIDQLRSLLVDNRNNRRPIFIEGPSGVGKTLLAEATHNFLIGNKGNFVHINCKGLSENLLESELFGHERGAFTDAKSSKIGKLKLADNGTLFLDEVATMPIKLQTALLVAIEKKQFMPVGGNRLVQSNFRLVCATNEDITQLVHEAKFREDLFYRIYKYVIYLRPLRERSGDIPLLINHFHKKSGDRRIVIRPKAMEILQKYQYPANVRDIEDIVDILLREKSGIIEITNLPSFVINNENRYFKNNTPSTLDSNVNNINNIIEEVRVGGLRKYMNNHKKMIVNRFIGLHHGKTKEAMKEMKYFSSRVYENSESLAIQE